MLELNQNRGNHSYSNKTFLFDITVINMVNMVPKIINLTPHDINIVNNAGEVIITYPPMGVIPRLREILRDYGDLLTNVYPIPVEIVSYGETLNLPDQELNTYLIVSKMIADANLKRTDLLFPGELVRNDKGQIIGCKTLRITASRKF